MKQLLIVLSFFLTITCTAQKWSFDLDAAMYFSTGVGDTEFRSTGLYDGIEPGRANSASFQINYSINDILSINLGLGLASYQYKPLTDLQFGSQNQNGSFRDIGFNENGLVENTFLKIPLGIESKIELGKIDLFPHFQFVTNYSLRESPLISLDQETNKVFLTGAFGLGISLAKRKKITMMLIPFIEYKPYDLDLDHAYSNEKLLMTGLKLRCRIKNSQAEL